LPKEVIGARGTEDIGMGRSSLSDETSKDGWDIPSGLLVRNGNLEKGSSPGESQIALGPGRTLKRTKVVAIP